MSEPTPHPKTDSRPIGIFDSGIGGLTVVKQIMNLLPNERIYYFGDTARIPYGTKSVEVVKRFALEDSHFLLDKGVKMIIAACNTASALAIRFLKEVLPVPVIGVIQPGAMGAVEQTRNGKVGVIGTTATIRSNSYLRELHALRPELQVFSQPCPLFVPLVEEGWIEDEATYLIARRYLLPLMENKVDTIILGCTHYPLLKGVIRRTVGDSIQLVDSGIEVARQVKALLEKHHLAAPPNHFVEHRFYLSDLPYKFQEIGERFLERSLPHVATVNFEDYLLSKGQAFWKNFEEKLKKDY